MAQKTYGIDFGTGTIKIYKKGNGIVKLERNVVSTVGKENKPIAIGETAYEMYEKEPPSIHVSFPLQHGVIAHMQDMIALWNYMNYSLSGKKKIKGCEYYLAVPADITEVEKQAYSQIISRGETKPKKVFLVDKPVANAFGLGLDVEKLRGAMIIDVGADTTEISVLSLGGIVVSKLLPSGGNELDMLIRSYVRKEYNFLIGCKTAEQAKKELIAATTLDRSMKLVGRDVVKGLPGEITLTSAAVAPLATTFFETIITQTRSIMEHTPPEISMDIKERGIYLTGGSSEIHGLAALLQTKTGVAVNISDKPQETAVSGLGYFAEHGKQAAKYVTLMK